MPDAANIILLVAAPGILKLQANLDYVAGASSDVQLGQRVAAIAIVDMQKGQSLVVGSAGGASSSRLRLFMLLISMNTAKATIRKLIIALKKIP